jgi:hypothetical protein
MKALTFPRNTTEHSTKTVVQSPALLPPAMARSPAPSDHQSEGDLGYLPINAKRRYLAFMLSPGKQSHPYWQKSMARLGNISAQCVRAEAQGHAYTTLY